MHGVGILVPVVLAVYLATASWQQDFSVQWLVSVLKPALPGHDQHERIA
jgi:hypothetical protein